MYFIKLSAKCCTVTHFYLADDKFPLINTATLIVLLYFLLCCVFSWNFYIDCWLLWVFVKSAMCNFQISLCSIFYCESHGCCYYFLSNTSTSCSHLKTIFFYDDKMRASVELSHLVTRIKNIRPAIFLISIIINTIQDDWAARCHVFFVLEMCRKCPVYYYLCRTRIAIEC